MHFISSIKVGFYLFLLILLSSCNIPSKQEIAKPLDTTLVAEAVAYKPKELQLAADRLKSFLPLIKGKKVGLIVNASSRLSNRTYLVDTLITRKINVVKLFAPEHGIRGKASAGEHIEDGKDTKTGLPIISLYGKNKKPKPEQLAGIEVMVFDLQDVGARFYTYISTMHYAMEACAENNIPFIVLDRPNPNGHFVDGPVLDTANMRSFVGLHPIPIVHGLTVGELAHMIKGEQWIANANALDLAVIPCANYTHQTKYNLPVKPSPNLPNPRSIALYPHLCLFEGTSLSVGRGTDFPFQVIGHPNYPEKQFNFTPIANEGAKYPKHENLKCFGRDFRASPNLGDSLWLAPLFDAFKKLDQKESFFKPIFDKLSGTTSLRNMMLEGKSEAEIRKSWKGQLESYKTMRKKYLIYP